MSYSFDGVDDTLDSTGNHTLGSIVTFAGWQYSRTITPKGQTGIIQHQIVGGGYGANSRLCLGLDWGSAGANSRLAWYTRGATAGGRWTTPIDSLTLNRWYHCAGTYDGTVATNDPLLYLNGVSQTVTTNVQRQGAMDSDGRAVRLATQGDAQSPLDGYLAECAIWKRILKPAEIAAVYLLGVLAVPDVYQYWPLDLSAREYAANSPYTVSGAIAGSPNPPIRPAGRK